MNSAVPEGVLPKYETGRGPPQRVTRHLLDCAPLERTLPNRLDPLAILTFVGDFQIWFSVSSTRPSCTSHLRGGFSGLV